MARMKKAGGDGGYHDWYKNTDQRVGRSSTTPARPDAEKAAVRGLRRGGRVHPARRGDPREVRHTRRATTNTSTSTPRTSSARWTRRRASSSAGQVPRRREARGRLRQEARARRRDVQSRSSGFPLRSSAAGRSSTRCAPAFTTARGSAFKLFTPKQTALRSTRCARAGATSWSTSPTTSKATVKEGWREEARRRDRRRGHHHDPLLRARRRAPESLQHPEPVDGARHRSASRSSPTSSATRRWRRT